MYQEASTVILAGVAHVDPNEPADWLSFLALPGAVFGLPLVIAGVGVTAAIWRMKGRRKWGEYVIGPVILLVGLAIAVPCFGFAFHLF
ncbi:hypothetical protein [Streptomyces sp. WZ-12]|uniref:hypothetical protein n=1 Tax=Streptomyces sp. WZ-12 TaxID=3030210 RepID=UPI0023817D40|nr:hypothetical protein [Streptomyces sp. WZ-12]